MQEDIIKEIFNDYEPELSSRMDFINRLERNLDAVELIHKENAIAMKRNKLAVAVASAAGFTSGIIFSLLIPYINQLISEISSRISTDIQLLNKIADYQHVAMWLIIGGISVLISLYTYKNILRHGINFQLSKDEWQEDQHPSI
ncbi:MAG: hypothetical protein K2G13_05695 [Muribaculaceae bacterium]|nr:hypothetical protein [Muribaculaceae bacterium]